MILAIGEKKGRHLLTETVLPLSLQRIHDIYKSQFSQFEYFTTCVRYVN